MPRGATARINDVRRIVQAAREVVDARLTHVDALARSTGLSREGVELAMTKHLEVAPTEEELHRLVERAGDASRVAVILSSNVFAGALRAIAIARAASEEVIVRPSRRDPVFARALVAASRDAGLRLEESLDVAALDGGELHIYGHDRTITELRACVRPVVTVRGHGSGLGVAWISGDADLDVAARDLAEDVVVFDQRGCMSPRIALIHGPQERADAFADVLHAELERFGARVPRGPLPADERASSDRYVAAMTYAHRTIVGDQHVVGVAPPGAPMIPCPAYRHLHLVPCRTREDATTWLGPLVRSIVAVGSDDEVAARALAPRWARVTSLGRMQRAPLDGPVDLREH